MVPLVEPLLVRLLRVVSLVPLVLLVSRRVPREARKDSPLVLVSKLVERQEKLVQLDSRRPLVLQEQLVLRKESPEVRD